MKIEKNIPVPRKYHRMDIWNEVASNMEEDDSKFRERVGDALKTITVGFDIK